MSRAEIKRMVRTIPRTLGPPYSEAWTAEESQAALVILATVGIGRDSGAVSRFTGVPLHVVEQYNQRLADNGIWTPDGGARVGWFAMGVLATLISLGVGSVGTAPPASSAAVPPPTVVVEDRCPSCGLGRIQTIWQAVRPSREERLRVLILDSS